MNTSEGKHRTAKWLKAGSGGSTSVVIYCAVCLVGDALSGLLTADGIELVGASWDFGDVLGWVERCGAGALLVDAGCRDAFGVIGRVRKEAPAWRILGLGLSTSMRDEDAWRRAGAAGCILPWDSRERALDKIRTAGGMGPAREETGPLHSPQTPPHSAGALSRVLTARESEVLRLMAQGLSNKEIADRLCLQIGTVKNHVHSVLAKLHLNRRAQVGVWLRNGVNPQDR